MAILDFHWVNQCHILMRDAPVWFLDWVYHVDLVCCSEMLGGFTELWCCSDLRSSSVVWVRDVDWRCGIDMLVKRNTALHKRRAVVQITHHHILKQLRQTSRRHTYRALHAKRSPDVPLQLFYYVCESTMQRHIWPCMQLVEFTLIVGKLVYCLTFLCTGVTVSQSW